MGNSASSSQLLLSAFMTLPLPISFTFIWNTSLSIVSLYLSLPLWLTLYYASLSIHDIWHVSSAFSLSIFSSSFSRFVLSHPSILVCQPFLSLSLSPFGSSPLCDIARAAHSHACANTFTLMHAQSRSHRPSLAEIIWPIWAVRHCSQGLCTIVHVKCRVCVYVCALLHGSVRFCTGDRECFQKCEIEDLRRLHLSRGCDFNA